MQPSKNSSLGESDGANDSQKKDDGATGPADYVTPGGRYLRPRTRAMSPVTPPRPRGQAPAAKTPAALTRHASSNHGGNSNNAANAAAAGGTVVAAKSSPPPARATRNNRSSNIGNGADRGSRRESERIVTPAANHGPMVPARDMITMAKETMTMEDWEMTGTFHSPQDVNESKSFRSTSYLKSTDSPTSLKPQTNSHLLQIWPTRAPG